MSYFAELDNNNIVKRVIVADSKEWCEQGLGGIWVNAQEPLIAGVGMQYNENDNSFIELEPIVNIEE
jgi:hypothetical protein